MMRFLYPTLLVLLACLSALWSPVAATAQQQSRKQEPRLEELKADDQPLSFWMEKKMEYSQDMLRGLVSGDLQKVADRAEQMKLVSKVEGWLRGKIPGYRVQSQVFEFANNEILRQGRANNLEGTTMAFQQLTASCVSCHRMIRETNGDGHPVEEKPKVTD